MTVETFVWVCYRGDTDSCTAPYIVVTTEELAQQWKGTDAYKKYNKLVLTGPLTDPEETSRRADALATENNLLKLEMAVRDGELNDQTARVQQLTSEVEKLGLELMAAQVKPDYERGELAGQDAMMHHIAKLTEESNSALAEAVRKCDLVKNRCFILQQVAEYLEIVGYKVGEKLDLEALVACRSELSILQRRAEFFGGPKES